MVDKLRNFDKSHNITDTIHAHIKTVEKKVNEVDKALGLTEKAKFGVEKLTEASHAINEKLGLQDKANKVMNSDVVKSGMNFLGGLANKAKAKITGFTSGLYLLLFLFCF